MRFVFEICSGSYSLWQEKHVVIMTQSIFTPFPRQKWRCFCCEKNYTLYYCCNPLGEEFPWAKMPLPTAASFFYLAQAKAFPCDSLCPAFCWFDCLLTFLQYTSILSFISGVWKEPFFGSKRLLLLCCCTTQYKIKQTEFQLAIGRWHSAFFPSVHLLRWSRQNIPPPLCCSTTISGFPYFAQLLRSLLLSVLSTQYPCRRQPVWK